MEKVQLEYKAPENRTVEYNGVNIEVKAYLDLPQQIALINRYTSQYFGKEVSVLVDASDYNYLTAEYNLINYIMQSNTNIDTDGMDDNIYSDILLWEKITSQIINYVDFRNKLSFIINEIKQQEVIKNSLGKVLSDLVKKGYELLEGLSDISPEQIESAKTAGLELIKKLEESSVLGNMPAPEMKD